MLCRLRGACGEDAFALQVSSTLLARLGRRQREASALGCYSQIAISSPARCVCACFARSISFSCSAVLPCVLCCIVLCCTPHSMIISWQRIGHSSVHPLLAALSQAPRRIKTHSLLLGLWQWPPKSPYKCKPIGPYIRTLISYCCGTGPALKVDQSVAQTVHNMSSQSGRGGVCGGQCAWRLT